MNIPSIISFRGAVGCGKSTCAQYVSEKYGHTRISFADALKLEVYSGLVSYDPYIHGEYAKKYPAQFENLPRLRVRNLYQTAGDSIKDINENKATVGHLLQTYGTEYRRAQDPDYWVRKFDRTRKTYLEYGITNLVVDDTRFENEIQYISSLGGVHILVVGGNPAANLGNRDMNHPSEENRLVRDTDSRIISNLFGKERLYRSIDLVLEGIAREAEYGATKA